MGNCRICKSSSMDVSVDRSEPLMNIIPGCQLTSDIEKVTNLIEMEKGMEVPEEDPDTDIRGYSLNLNCLSETSLPFQFEGELFMQNNDSSLRGVITKTNFLVFRENQEEEIVNIPIEQIQYVKTYSEDGRFFMKISDATVFVDSEEEWSKWTNEFQIILNIPILEYPNK